MLSQPGPGLLNAVIPSEGSTSQFDAQTVVSVTVGDPPTYPLATTTYWVGA